MSRVKSLICGIGRNDANYVVQKFSSIEDRYPSGRKKQVLTWVCPYYSSWSHMIKRCYSQCTVSKNPSYMGCTVEDDWLLFSTYRVWMIQQDWEGNQLDKDILFEGNKVYSERTCVFVYGKVNSFLVGCDKSRGKYLIGVYWHKSSAKYISQISNPFGKSQVYLGLYNTEIEAHLAWKKRKHEYACELADSSYVTDDRVRVALRNRYKNYMIVEENLS